jgi:hypothetical protein
MVYYLHPLTWTSPEQSWPFKRSFGQQQLLGVTLLPVLIAWHGQKDSADPAAVQFRE